MTGCEVLYCRQEADIVVVGGSGMQPTELKKEGMSVGVQEDTA